MWVSTTRQSVAGSHPYAVPQRPGGFTLMLPAHFGRQHRKHTDVDTGLWVTPLLLQLLKRCERKFWPSKEI